MNNWYKNSNGIAVSTRIRLARNIEGLPFPNKMSDESLKELNLSISKEISKGNFPDGINLKYIDMQSVSDIERRAMRERHIISTQFAESPYNRAILINDDETISVMIGEEDHLRIQVISAGLDLDEAYKVAEKVDNYLSSFLNYAYDKNLGFLTECPTNLGIGLRASVMLHLPVLESSGELSEIIENAGKIGLAVRGLYGEGSGSSASLYQISNQITLGITEQNAIENLKVIATQIIDKESALRARLNKISLEDKVWRAYGILKFARKLSSDELMGFISTVKLGVDLGIIDEDGLLPIKMMVESLPGMLQKRYGEMTPDDRDISRAEFIRETLN